jgi:ankyrin repeat protein/mono/diheme cytochrome c family protein
MNARLSISVVPLRAVTFAALVSFLPLCSRSLAAAESAPSNDLVRAVQRGDTAAWQSLLKAKADVTGRNAAGNTGLHVAALNHDLAAVEALLAAGAEVDAKNNAGATALLYGAGHAGVVRALLARGANPNVVSTAKNTPLIAAVAHPDSHEAARALIDASADVKAKKANDIEVPLSRAMAIGDRRTVDLLLERGAGEDPKSLTAALSAAAFRGDTQSVEMLLARGADANLDPTFEGHALNSALLGEQLDVALLLIEKGADPNLRSPAGHGTPPIVFAAYNQKGDPSVAKALVARGVDVNTANDEGATVLGWALRSGRETPLAEYLRSVGAKSSEPARAKRVPDRPVPSNAAARAVLVRERLPATIALLQRSSDAFLENGFVQKSNCTSCHGQDLPAVMYGLARERGFTVDEVSLGRQLAAQLSRWDDRAEAARQMTSPLPGSPATIAYGLFGLHAIRHPADDMTDAMVRYLTRTQQADGHWIDPIRRPPMEDGDLVATAWVTLSLRDYALRGHEGTSAVSLARAARWLARQKAGTHNEAAFQLLGLHWSGAPRSQLDEFAAKLIARQRPDGGWAQLAGLESDAWATGTALYALHEAGRMPATDAVYQRGVAFLLRTQFEDGSWWIRTRTWPFQPHFNGRFPHGRDQWISQAGTAWAAMALLFTIDPIKPAPPIPKAQELIAAYKKSPAAQRRKADDSTAVKAATVDFVRDIKPLLDRSCAECHGKERQRGGLSMETRELLLKGGQSGESVVVPGDAEESPMFQYASGKIEDLEMPPLERRDKYPAFAPAELALLRTWIDSGAPWAAATPAKVSSRLP